MNKLIAYSNICRLQGREFQLISSFGLLQISKVGPGKERKKHKQPQPENKKPIENS